MIYKSASSSLTDAYRAGSEIGETLRGICPEVILLFTSITFDSDYEGFFSGLYDALETRDVIVFGGTGDGIYETSLTAHYGVSALGFASGGRIRWSASIERGVGNDSEEVSRRCATVALERIGGEPSWACVLADGVTADGTGVASGVRDVLTIPFIGGMTGDDRKFTRSRVFLNGEAVEDGVAVLLAKGEFPCFVSTTSGFTPIGAAGVVEVSHGKTVSRIGGRTAQAFIREQIGKTLAESDHGIVALATYTDDTMQQFFMRASSGVDPQTESVRLFGSIPEGAIVRVSCAGREQLLRGVSKSVEALSRSGFQPAAAIIVSCAGRKWQLNSCGQEEVAAFQDALGHNLPLIGFPSFGELGPFLQDDNSCSESFFHNVSLVVCFLGESA